MYELTENLRIASLAALDFSLLPCNIKQSCHSSGQQRM